MARSSPVAWMEWMDDFLEKNLIDPIIGATHYKEKRHPFSQHAFDFSTSDPDYDPDYSEDPDEYSDEYFVL